jgi:hypothetical protein
VSGLFLLKKTMRGGNTMYLRKGVYYTDFYDDSGKRRRRSLRTADAAVAAAKEGELRSLDAPALAHAPCHGKNLSIGIMPF